MAGDLDVRWRGQGSDRGHAAMAAMARGELLPGPMGMEWFNLTEGRSPRSLTARVPCDVQRRLTR